MRNPIMANRFITQTDLNSIVDSAIELMRNEFASITKSMQSKFDDEMYKLKSDIASLRGKLKEKEQEITKFKENEVRMMKILSEHSAECKSLRDKILKLEFEKQILEADKKELEEALVGYELAELEKNISEKKRKLENTEGQNKSNGKIISKSDATRRAILAQKYDQIFKITKGSKVKVAEAERALRRYLGQRSLSSHEKSEFQSDMIKYLCFSQEYEHERPLQGGCYIDIAIIN
jgi:chromosome segregation ATPase